MITARKPLDWSYKQIKLMVFANLLRISVDIYGSPNAKENLSKVDGEEFVMDFPALGGSIVIKPQGNRILASVGDSEDPTARITINVKEEKVFDVLEDIAKSSQRWGIIKLFFKYLLWRRIKIKGSLRKASTTFKTMMLGDYGKD